MLATFYTRPPWKSTPSVSTTHAPMPSESFCQSLLSSLRCMLTSRSDLVFIQDATGSQGSYITHSTVHIQRICADIISHGGLSSQEDLRVGLIAFRDHPPQDHTYVTKNFGFTSDIGRVHENLKTLYASGGGDGPEAVTAALWDALNLDWRPTASKMIVLIADAPPHGIGEYGDGELISAFLTF